MWVIRSPSRINRVIAVEILGTGSTAWVEPADVPWVRWEAWAPTFVVGRVLSPDTLIGWNWLLRFRWSIPFAEELVAEALAPVVSGLKLEGMEGGEKTSELIHSIVSPEN